jgi:hypothetical protein
MSPTSRATAAPLDVAEVHALLDQVRDAFNKQDLDGFVAPMRLDVELEHVAAEGPIHGRDAVASFYGDGLWPAFSDMQLELVAGPFLHPTEPSGMVAWRFRGTHSGRLDPPGLDPTGRTVDVLIHERWHFKDDKVARLVIVFDVASMMRQLGVLPEAGTGMEALLMRTQNVRTSLGRLAGRTLHREA